MSERGIKNVRVGRSRFIVPHAAFDWYVRGIALAALVCGAFTGLASWVYHLELFDALGLGNQAGWPELATQYGRLSLMAGGVVMITMALFMTLISMFLFHRIVGPIYRLKQHMTAVANGEDVQALRLRDTDQLADVCEVYNQMLVALDVIAAEKPEATTPKPTAWKPEPTTPKPAERA